MIEETDVILKSLNKFEVGIMALAWRNSDMQECKVKIIEEDGMWYLVKDRG